ncbi:MAG: type IX secretion system membrane protein PorP/SprF [Flavobacteriales bacterium]|nr:type IX secretion system membrane protein PorP/SprF [Flavobacteriales bacterium]MEB2340781.1 type IX secretion system membrane protein PorP/SprF [Flavobacteriia bacterium]
MRSLRIPLSAALAVFLGMAASAQQELMTSQYMFNGLFLNPAYAGSHPYATATALHRSQWVGMEGAPRTNLLGVDAPMMDGKMGLGLTFSHDRIGVSRDMEVAAQYAYRIRTGTRGHLAFGLKAGVSMYTANLSDLVYWDAQDAVYQGNISNAAVGKFGFGLYWHDERTYIGLSVPTLQAADKQLVTDLATTPDHYFTQHYYFNAGHVFELNDNFDLKPSVLLKYQQQAPPEVDLNLNVLFKERFWLGAGYRTGDAIVAMVEYQISPMFRAGYAYDMTTSALRRYNGGSHEVMLGIDLGREPVMIKNPRYF